MARNYHQGKYTPRNPQKYIGDPNNIIYRSSWEKRLMIRFDTDPSILQWGSEEFHIPYLSPVDMEMHRYFPDFVVKCRTADGTIRKVLIEVKPYAETQLPKQPKRRTKSFDEKVKTYAVNQAKWAAAKQWCKKHDVTFQIITENELGIGKK